MTSCVSDTNPILQGVVQNEGNTTKVLSWHQCQPGGVYTAADGTVMTCPTKSDGADRRQHAG